MTGENGNKPTILPEEAEAFYNYVSSGSDFYFYQDCVDPEPPYDEHYFNPDCVLLFPDTRQVYWFDLDYLTLSQPYNAARLHLPWTMRRRKFAFSHHGNQISVLEYSLLQSKVNTISEFRQQSNINVRYIQGELYQKLCEFNNGVEYSSDGHDLESEWMSNRKMKIGVRLGNSILIYGVRLAYRSEEIYSFASKTLVIPNHGATDFSWDQASIGNISVSSDRSCSIYRENKPQNSLRNLIAFCFPEMVRRAGTLVDPALCRRRERIKRIARYIGPLLSKYVLPFEIEHRECSFTVYTPVN